MGQTLLQLSQRKIEKQSVFHNRFVVEICERVHTHYRSLRITNSIHDWLTFANGMTDAVQRWKKRGAPGTSKERHIELVRKSIQSEVDNDTIQINLNKNLYIENKDKIFSEGAGIEEPYYIHFKIRDIRIELSLNDFKEVCNAVKEAEESVKNSGFHSLLQEAGVHQEVS